MTRDPASQSLRQATERSLVDDADRYEIRSSLRVSQIVEAAAGTGKTKVLVDRIVQIIVQGCGELRQMVVVTFTEKAAGELKLRIRQELERAMQSYAADGLANSEGGDRINAPKVAESTEAGVATERLALALKQLEEAHIGTIHGFSADLLREYPVQAGVDPAFSVLAADQQARWVLDRVYWRWLRGLSAAPPEGLRRILRRKYFHYTKRSVLEELRRSAQSIVDNRDLDRAYADVDFKLAEVVPPLLRRVREASAAVHRFEAEVGRPASSCFPLTTLAEELDRLGEGLGLEEVEARLWDLPLSLSLPKGPTGSEAFRTASGQIAQLIAALKAFQRRSGAQLASLLQHELSVLVEDYQEEKKSLGVVDFLDLLIGARDLLGGDRAVRAEVQQRFSHIFVDEFQDTDPLQAEILLLLASDDPEVDDWRKVHPKAGGLFIVGDPQQSIYRFRRADLSLYGEIKERLRQFDDVRFLQLKTSFRALPQIQRAINGAFSPVGKTQKHYMPLAAHRRNVSQAPEIVAIPLCEQSGDRVCASDLRREEPAVLAAWLEWLLKESGWHVTNRATQQLEPVRPHHIALLFNKMRSAKTDLTARYVEELEHRGIPLAVVGRPSLGQREEVEALRTALRVIEWPAEALSVYATLRGPLFGFDDRCLFLFRQAGGRFDAAFSEQPEAGADFEAILAALKLFEELHSERNLHPISSTIEKLLAKTRCVVGFALRSDGRRALKSLNRLQQMARRFEVTGGISFRSFISYLEEQLDNGGGAEEDVFEERGGGIRLMTAHAAKGLEFPVVILADAASKVSRWVGSVSDRHQRLFATELCGCRSAELTQGETAERDALAQEASRLLYVATTRARDLLVVPTPHCPNVYQGWLSPLERVLHGGTRLQNPGPGLPTFFSAEGNGGSARRGVSGVFEHEVDQQTGHGAAPSFRVAWWETQHLPKRPARKEPLRFGEILKTEGKWADDSRRRYEKWESARQDLIENAHRPKFELLSATALAHAEGEVGLGNLQPISLEGRSTPRETFGEDGRAHGILVHGILEHLDFGRGAIDEPYLVGVGRIWGKEFGCSESELQRALADIRVALVHPLLQRAARADTCLREMPLTLCVEECYPPKIVEGIVDLVFVEGDQVVVVDYKTDGAPNAEALHAYRQQVALYLRAIAAATGLDVSGHLLLI